MIVKQGFDRGRAEAGERAEHPVDVVERFASLRDYSFDREEEDEITIGIEGRWTRYNAAITWLPDLEALHLACAFDLKVPERRRGEVRALVGLINEQSWIGHFDLWGCESVVMYRYAMLLAGGAEPSEPQCEAVLSNAVAACERYYQAFQFVVWAGKSAREALDGALFETAGQA